MRVSRTASPSSALAEARHLPHSTTPLVRKGHSFGAIWAAHGGELPVGPRTAYNYEQLRRVLPKGRSDFDALSALDAAVLTSHVNSYPLAGRGGRCAFELAAGLLPRALLDEMGWERVPSDEVVLAPSLLPHAVER